jgi:hypothetical protein
LEASPVKPLGAPHYAVAAGVSVVVMTGVDGTVHYTTARTGKLPSFGPWIAVRGVSAASEPAVVGDSSGNIDVYVTGMDSQVHRSVYVKGAWSPWSSLSADGAGTTRVAGAPAAAAIGADRVELVVASETGSLLATSGPSALGGAWQAWHTVPAAGTIKPDVALTESTDGTLAAYVIRASDLAVLRVVNDGRWEYGWQTGGVGHPEAAYIRSGKPYLFIRTVSGDVHVYEPSGANLKGTFTWVSAGVSSPNPIGVWEDPGSGLVMAVSADDGSVRLYTWSV